MSTSTTSPPSDHPDTPALRTAEDDGQLSLDLADVDAPIPFALTARARRAVAPDALPDLRLVPVAPASPSRSAAPRPGPVAVTPLRASQQPDRDVHVDADDPRRPRARALVRGGAGIGHVAGQLGVDEAAVVVWTSDLRPRGLDAVVEVPAGERDGPDLAVVRDRARRDGRFAAGLALVAAHAETTEHGVVVRVDSHELAARMTTWLVSQADVDPLHVRVILVLDPATPQDRALRELRQRVPLPSDRVQATRAIERAGVVIRVADAEVARRVRTWSDALATILAEPGDGLDDAVSC